MNLCSDVTESSELECFAQNPSYLTQLFYVIKILYELAVL